MLKIFSIEEVSVKWTEPMIERVKFLLNDGCAYSEIANLISREFDCRVTRNAVISRAKRSGLADLNKNPRHLSRNFRQKKNREKPNSVSARLIKFRPPIPRPATRKRREPLDLVLQNLGEPERLYAKPLIETLRNECMWPVSEEDERPILFCCRPRMKMDLPYCPHHMARSARRMENGGDKK